MAPIDRIPRVHFLFHSPLSADFSALWKEDTSHQNNLLAYEHWIRGMSSLWVVDQDTGFPVGKKGPASSASSESCGRLCVAPLLVLYVSSFSIPKSLLTYVQ